MFSDFLSVTSAERQIYSSCPNKTCILFNYIDSGLGKSVSSCLCTALSKVATLAYSQEFSFKSLCSVVNKPGQHQFGNRYQARFLWDRHSLVNSVFFS